MATILEIFIEKEKESGAIEALKFLNEYIQKIEINSVIEDEIVDFGEYFIDNFEESTDKERFDEWGYDDALILQYYDLIVAKAILEDDFFENCQDILTSLDRPMLKEMEKLYDAIVFYPGLKKITCEFSDKYHLYIDVDEKLNKEQIFQLKSILAKAVKDGGFILVDLIDKKIATSFLTVEHEVKTVIPIITKKLHNMDFETGKKLKVKHKGYKYIEANKLVQIFSEGNY